MRVGLAVQVGARPAILAHTEDGRWWVSFTDRGEPQSRSVRPRDVTRS